MTPETRVLRWSRGLVLCLVLGACATTSSERHSTVSYEPVSRRRAPSAIREAPTVPPSGQVVTPQSEPVECVAYAPLVRSIAAEIGVDAGLLAGIATVESGWKPRAKSNSGARGLLQIMPSTGRRLDCGDLFQADDNLRCGARLLLRLLARYDGAVDYALAAYALGAKVPDHAFKRGSEAPRQPFIKRVLSARRAWIGKGCS